MMKVTKVSLGKIEPNLGQIPGLPLNPRTWTKGDVEKIAASLKETPELFEARPLIVYPYADKYIIIGGNLRFEGAKLNGDASAPCVILPAEMPADKLKELVIKDNGSFGQWDVEELASMWKDLPLVNWGVPASFVKSFNLDDFSRISDENKPEDPALFYKITLKIPAIFQTSKEEIVKRIREVLNGFEGIQIGS